ncbi:hypothetical protein UABAM_05392 [Candidatus Uabimicrobium amorphum]|uniref:Uncharacterized protein n=2 Tax=Uabimicrobium amorphum TaxID=2596890 RepID=A0A5S9ITQ8_UABAM|nr:hypothetical protein UABAM_05392 [Candidatus Uabimicrobium amorphum]
MDAGLCDHCQHVKKIINSRGSTFYLCLLSQSDERFRKYPQLPMVECPGYQPQPNENQS